MTKLNIFIENSYPEYEIDEKIYNLNIQFVF